MPYPARLLSEGEEVLEESRQHWVALRDEILYSIGWLLLMIVLVPWLDFPLDEWIGWIATAAWLFLAGSGVARWVSTELILTNKRVIFRTGVLSKSGYEVANSQIQHAGYRQSGLQRMVGAGDLLIDAPAAGGKSVVSDVDQPQHLAGIVTGTLESPPARSSRLPGAPTERTPQPERPARSTESPPRQGSLSRAEQLDIIARLHAEGKLSDEEFVVEKARILKSE